MTRQEIKEWAKETTHRIFHKAPTTVEFVFPVGTDANTTLIGPLLRRLWQFIKGEESEIVLRIKKD